MNELANKLKEVETEIAAEKGKFLVYALVLRDKGQDRWDLIVSAFWIPTKKRGTLDYIIGKLSRKLSKKEMQRISRIVLLDPLDPLVTNLQSVFHVEHGMAEVVNSVLNNVHFDHAYIITSQR